MRILKAYRIDQHHPNHVTVIEEWSDGDVVERRVRVQDLQAERNRLNALARNYYVDPDK